MSRVISTQRDVALSIPRIQLGRTYLHNLKIRDYLEFGIGVGVQEINGDKGEINCPAEFG